MSDLAGKIYYENVVHWYVLISFYLSNAIVYVLYISCIFSSFLLCCNANSFVICVIQNYLLTYLLIWPKGGSWTTSLPPWHASQTSVLDPGRRHAFYQSIIYYAEAAHKRYTHKLYTTYNRKTIKNKNSTFISYEQTEHNRSRQLDQCIYKMPPQIIL